ncbi:MAG TPA: succinate dehydrogenase cytochrome b subunit [Actinomycetales bacterium]|nr:succinate dehydrogenase cytochrome b subunit [Actinomycetales bacterium]
MATSNLTQRRTAMLRSSVALKAAMAVTGFILVLFLIAHMYGNLKIFEGQAAFDIYSASLRTLGEPILPHGGALWIMRIVLLASVLIHITAAVILWRRARVATSGKGSARYYSSAARRGAQRTYASFTLRWGGIVIALFVVYHLLHLTVNVIAPGGASESPYVRTVNGFEIWWVVLSYAIALLALGFHLRHGMWAAFASLGANKSPQRRRNLNIFAIVIALVITVGFLVPPVAVLFGWVS